MVLCVADASIVVKWFLEEEFSRDARRLRDDYVSDLVELEAPALLPFEVLNAVRYAGVFSNDELRRVAEALDAFAVPTRPLEGPLAVAAVDIASSTDLTVYDASYVALAHELGATLYTADQALLRATKRLGGPAHIETYRTPEE